LIEYIAVLQAHRTEFRHPVRLLAVDCALPCTARLCRNLEQHRPAGAGQISIIDMSDAQFGVEEFRALVGARPTRASGERMQLVGTDRT